MNGAVWEEVEPFVTVLLCFLPFTYLGGEKSAFVKDEKRQKFSLFIFMTLPPLPYFLQTGSNEDTLVCYVMGSLGEEGPQAEIRCFNQTAAPPSPDWSQAGSS